MAVDITDAERAVMEVLWQQSPLGSGEIAARVSLHRAWHRRTVNTLIRRLVDKGAVNFEQSSGGYLYAPLVERDDYRQSEARKLVSELFDGKITPLLACFAETETLSNADLKELKKLVSKLAK